jgi:hypothetical protein
VKFDEQFEGSATVFTEVTGRDIVCGAGYVACRDLSYSERLRVVVTEFVCDRPPRYSFSWFPCVF